jgi:hypothetical protein
LTRDGLDLLARFGERQWELLEYDMLKRRGMQPFAETSFLSGRYGVDSGVGGKANDNVIDEWVSPQRLAGLWPT